LLQQVRSIQRGADRYAGLQNSLPHCGHILVLGMLAAIPSLRLRPAACDAQEREQ
jgi:hypothetical protein